MSQAQLAKAVGAGQSTIASIENGRNKGSSLFLDLARALNVNVEWLMDGAGPKRGSGGDDGDARPAASIPPAPWPFRTIPEDQLRALPESQLNALEGAISLAIAQMKIGIQVAPRPHSLASPENLPMRSDKPGGLIDMDAADDPFPMSLPGLPAPWESGRTTAQDEREPTPRLATRLDVVANVGPGEPHAANDRFEKVPELADVRLAAGDGIENHNEEQTGVIQFRKSFLRSVGADNGRGRVVYAKGDSMDPDIKDGWALLVVASNSLTPADLIPGDIYAINYDGKMIVKIIAKDELTGRWVARSKNKRYRDIPLEGEASVRILGRVAWAGGRLPSGVNG
ncbi:LexA family transcriptional regulator [Achromobacter mucicolens]|uniref:HTH cro/C1-type domain-containing protein n=2 Tax=Achromobacter mucicolens TaxID=1389922 RepID=A0ABM8LLT8_9BURK|nr:hypothetical protein LMG3415_05415 [Achromobacter mucicolens]